MVKKTLCFGIVVMAFQGILLLGTGFTFDPAHLEKMNSTNRCEKCDLRNANLANLDMYGVNLQGSDLSGADLSGASFHDANLTNTNLSGANIKGASFAGAKLSNAIWIDGKKCQPGSIGRCR